jgi:hypothetical protein
MADLLTITSLYNHDSGNYITVQKLEQYGGQQWAIGLTDEGNDLLSWVKDYKRQLDLEQSLRLRHPLVKDLYDQYQMALALVKNERE